MFEREYREMSFVPRWAIIRNIKQQSVAEHSYYVALYAGQVARLINWQGSYDNLYRAALMHDVSEVFMSDIPGPTKRAIIDHYRYNDYELSGLQDRFGDEIGAWLKDDIEPAEINAIIKVADLLDECFFLYTEVQLGNKTLGRVIAASRMRLFNATNKLPNINDGMVRIRINEAFIAALNAHIDDNSIIPTG